MPIYEYYCETCSYGFEKLENISADKETPCPKCGKLAQRKISAAAFHLSGSGFHNTDYKPKPCSAEGSKPACASCPAAKE